MSLPQNDPAEALEVFDADGRPTGVARSRAEIHLAGDWHQAFHCWIVRGDGREIVLQRRSLTKDTFAGLWDASAAGHWRFGESAQDAAREVDEELGIRVAFDQLEYRGRQVSDRTFPNGLIDREHHQVYVWRSDISLADLRPDPAEVSAVAAFPADDLIDVLSCARGSVIATEAVEVLSDRTVRRLARSIEARRDDFVPYSPGRLRGMLGRP